MVKTIERISLLKNKFKRIILEKLLSSKKQSNYIDFISNNKKEKITLKRECISEHFFTFQLDTDLFTLLYATIVFKWIQTDRILILVDNVNTGYQLELFLKNFKINNTFLDSDMPLNTNKHFCSQFNRGVYNICISCKNFNEEDFVTEAVEKSPIPITIIYFNTMSSGLLENHCFNSNVKAIYHIISTQNKKAFSQEYDSIDSNINFGDFKFDMDQVSHLRYRCEDIYYSINKSDIKKAKLKKINQELLNSKNMEEYFKTHPEEKKQVIKAINENSIKTIKHSASFLPSYLIHDQKYNPITQAISMKYGKGSISKKRKGKMESYFEAVDKNDGTAELIKF